MLKVETHRNPTPYSATDFSIRNIHRREQREVLGTIAGSWDGWDVQSTEYFRMLQATVDDLLRTEYRVHMECSKFAIYWVHDGVPDKPLQFQKSG